MIDNIRENLGLIVVFLFMAVLTMWVQFKVLGAEQQDRPVTDENDPDYYVENFVSIGMDQAGRLYDLLGDRMVHFPLDNKALLDNPHIVKYNEDDTITNIYADSGWLYNNAKTIRMTDNVRIVQEKSATEGGGVATTDKLIVHLKDD